MERELSPGRIAIIEKLEDHNAFYKKGGDKELLQEDDDEFKDAKDTADKKEGDAEAAKKEKSAKKVDRAKKAKKDMEAERMEAKKQLEAEFAKLHETDKYDPRKGVNFEKGDGKIQIEEKGVVSKFRYFLKKRKQPIDDEFPKYFKDFDWGQKGVVRKRFEKVSWPALMNKNFTMKDMKERLNTVREALKALEEVSGKISHLKSILND